MEEAVDEKLYEEYINGNESSFNILYDKYRSKIQYFIFNIIKDYAKSEDLTQDTFLCLMQDKAKIECSFKYYIYLVARRKAINHIKTNNRRENINKSHFAYATPESENDILESIVKKDSQREVLKAIKQIDVKYRNALYLVKIEGMSYKEAADILNETIINTKTLVYRGKIKVRNILLKKGFDEMNKSLKVLLIVICIGAILSGIIYATNIIYKKIGRSHNITINSTYESTLDEHTTNNLWVGTFDIAWKELSEVLGTKIEFEENINIVDELNSSKFSKDMLDEKDYEISVDKKYEKLALYSVEVKAKLNKDLSFLYPFNNFSDFYTKRCFSEGEEYIKYFGLEKLAPEEIRKTIDVLFYNSDNDFALKLNTKEGDEIILYRTDDVKTFEEYYNDVTEKNEKYTGSKEFLSGDTLCVPYIKLSGLISYNELIGKIIKGTNVYIKTAIQDVNFNLNEKGCNLSSNVTLVAQYMGGDFGRDFQFDDTFILFIKEPNINAPYFALKVDNQDILEKREEREEIEIVDYTKEQNILVDNVELKFYEDDENEYYFPSRKTPYVYVYYPGGGRETVDYALKKGKITIELLDKYNVEYIKKPK